MTQGLRDLAAEMRRAQDDLLEARPHASTDRLLAAVHAECGRRKVRGAISRRPSAGFVGACAAALAVAASVAAFVATRSPAPLSASTSSGDVAEGAWIVEPGPVAFTDGTTLTLASSARARLARLDARGAQVFLEQGTLHAAVVPRPGARWSVTAGPFEILVTGTKFDAAWSADSATLRVTMQEGSVKVIGACLPEAHPLRAGETRSFTCRAVSAPEAPVAAPEAPSAEAVVARPPAATPPANATPPERTGSPAPTSQESRWRELAKDGHFRDALLAAERQGFSAICAADGAAEVLALGDAARLAGNPARATEAYLAVRQRFPGTAAAAAAAFQLGRFAFDGARDYGSARRWFAVYLSEQPGGPLAQEALGRRMEAEHLSGDAGAARQAAARYLASSPSGAHAALARRLLEPVAPSALPSGTSDASTATPHP